MVMGIATVVIDNFDASRSIVGPYKTDAVLVIDTNAVLACPIILQCLKVIARRCRQIPQYNSRIEHRELPPRDRFKSTKLSDPPSLMEPSCVLAPEVDNWHGPWRIPLYGIPQATAWFPALPMEASNRAPQTTASGQGRLQRRPEKRPKVSHRMSALRQNCKASADRLFLADLSLSIGRQGRRIQSRCWSNSPASVGKPLAVCIRYDRFGAAQKFWIKRGDEMTARNVELSAQDRLAGRPDRDEPNRLNRTN